MRGLLAGFLGVLLLAVAGCSDKDSGAAGEPGAPGAFDSELAYADLEAQVEIGPRPSGSAGARETVALIESRLADAGIEAVTVQRPWRNVVAGLEGEQPGTVVVGAHYDTKTGIPGFVGANDGASGVAVLLELARSLPRPLPGPSVQLVFFDAEEARGERPFELDGTRGSRQYLELARRGEQGSAPVGEIGAMVLFDMVGDCDLQIPLEANSSPELYAVFADAPGDGDSPFGGRTGPISDDHVPFLEAGIPAVDLIDFDYGPGPSPGAWWHTPDDSLDKVCPESLDAVGEAAVTAIPRLGAE